MVGVAAVIVVAAASEVVPTVDGQVVVEMVQQTNTWSIMVVVVMI